VKPGVIAADGGKELDGGDGHEDDPGDKVEKGTLVPFG